MYFEFHHEHRQPWTPSVDVCERAHEIVIFVELPGLRRSDVHLSWHNGVLIITGRKPQQTDACVSRYHCVESNYGTFRRDIAINIPIDHAKARAELRDGLMRIYLPKRVPAPDSSTIPISE